MKDIRDVKVAVIGLGYVGLPLAVEFAKHFDTVGFDINAARVAELVAGHDGTLEVSDDELAAVDRLSCTAEVHELVDCDVYIVTVPTPIDSAKRPDLGALRGASRTVGGVLSDGNIVIYESTVYPGATELDCAPILEEVSGLEVNEQFFLGYSPERINPGDKEHRVTDILKVTSGSTPEAAEYIDTLYRTVIRAGTYKASSIQ
ncbi:MAG: nucleotide sugar dehydrogenase, partial [Gammaproteobacteria bacterium]